MSEERIIEGVNCPMARWTYRGIAMLASVVWLTRFTVEFLWPSLCSSWSAWKGEEGHEVVLLFAAPFLIFAAVVVGSFCVPVPVPLHVLATSEYSGQWFGVAGFLTMSVFALSHYGQNIEWCFYGFSLAAGLLAVFSLCYPQDDLCVQQVVFADFVLSLAAYLGYQRPVWIPCLFVFALLLVSSFLYDGRLRLDFKPPEEEDHV